MPRSPRRIHAYQAFGEALREAVAEAFPDREYVVWSEEEQFRRELGEVEVLLASRPPRGHWARAGRLRLVQMMGAGVDSLLPAPDLPATVRIANARGVHEPEMPEFALSLILALAKRIPRALDQQRRREWKIYGSLRLEGATAGILGLGAIGHSLAWRCKALGMRVIGTRRSPEPLEAVDQVFGPDQTQRVLVESDVVVVLLPLTSETRGLLDAGALSLMKRRSLLVNVARGGIVDEAALAKALEGGEIGGAAIDVFEQEPLPASSPLWNAPNCMVTPHVAGLSRDYMMRLGDIFLENIRRAEAGEPLLNQIDRARGY
jgi:phosphoglycerate dehydrogenase-like enzyme